MSQLHTFDISLSPRLAAYIVLAALVGWDTVLSAQDSPQEVTPPPAANEAEPAEREPIEKTPGAPLSDTPPPKVAANPDGKLQKDEDGDWVEREAPDYDGRGEDPTTAGDVLIWVPRVIFSPLYLVSEYVVRLPLGALTTAAEKGNWPDILISIFTFGEERKVGVFPTFLYEFELEPSVGLYFFADDVGLKGHDIRVHGGMWPLDWWSLTIKERFSDEEEGRQLAIVGNITERPDFLFTGLGPESDPDDDSYYRATVLQGGLEFRNNFWRRSSLGLYTGVRRALFNDDSDFGSHSISDRVAQGTYAMPPGFDEGYTSWRQEVELVLDTRLPRPEPGHGARLELNADHSWDIEANRGHRWAHYGGAVGGFWDVFGEHRVVSLAVDLGFADPIEGEVPFAELASLGGGGQPLFQGLQAGRHEPMEGFKAGHMLGRSSIAGTFEYRWPVWIWLDMAAHFAVGNVFGRQLKGFEWDLLRASFGLGLRSSTAVDSSLNLLIAFGTETFKDGTDIDSVRIVLGFRRGF
jgi:hypothetical protein